MTDTTMTCSALGRALAAPFGWRLYPRPRGTAAQRRLTRTRRLQGERRASRDEHRWWRDRRVADVPIVRRPPLAFAVSPPKPDFTLYFGMSFTGTFRTTNLTTNLTTTE